MFDRRAEAGVVRASLPGCLLFCWGGARTMDDRVRVQIQNRKKAEKAAAIAIRHRRPKGDRFGFGSNFQN